MGSDARLPGDYVAGHALGKTYTLDTLPKEGDLRSDLQTIVRAYRASSYRGGIDADVEMQTDVGEEIHFANQLDYGDRKYAFHRKIERNRTAARQAKNSMASAVRRVTSILRSATAQSARVSSKRITCGRLQR